MAEPANDFEAWIASSRIPPDKRDPDSLCEGISAAIASRDFEGVRALLFVLAKSDPRKAGQRSEPRDRKSAMGTSTDGILAYGYDLGGSEGEWKVRETGEYGALNVGWLPEEDDEDDEGDHDIVTLMEKRLLVASGFAETDWEAEGYFARERAAEESIGVKVESYCSGDYPMYVLAAKVITASRGDCEPIDMGALAAPELLAGWDAKLSAALGVLGITPEQEKPSWLLCSYWG